MKVRGLRGLHNLIYVDCEIRGTSPQFSAPLTLVMDTGCTRTTIMDKDAAILNLDYRKLDKIKTGILGIGGISRGWYLRGITITFPASNPPNHTESLETITVSKHVARTEERRIQINRVPSLLGLDVLSKSRITFNSQGAVMEFPPFSADQTT